MSDFIFDAAPDLAGAYTSAASSYNPQPKPENRAETATDYIRAATNILGGVDDVVRAFKGKPRRPSFQPGAINFGQADVDAFGLPKGFEPPNYSDVMSGGSERDAESVPEETDPFTAAVESAPEAVIGDEVEVPIFDEGTNEVVRFPRKFLEKHNYKIIQEGGQLKGYIRPDGTKVLYTK
jgi:hypothetical protein|tara:strand:- start:71 stop:610 length:540 start_codon:yes stop_codon:yes gene_type:complete